MPINEKEANIVIGYPDYPDLIKSDINTLWNNFYNFICKHLDQSYRITDSFEITRYMVGICDRPKIDNTYYAGNCFGAISPGLGFGQFVSILTGIYSAYDICGIGKYEELTKPLFENYDHSLEFKRYLESLTDDIIDFQVKNLDNKLLSRFIDKVSSRGSNLDLLKDLTPVMRLWNEFKKKTD